MDIQLFAKLEKWGCNTQAALERFVNDEELYKMCLNQFASELGFELLEDALKDKKYKESFEYAHMLKGVSANLGLIPLFESLDKYVRAYREGNMFELDECCLHVRQAYDKYCTIICNKNN